MLSGVQNDDNVVVLEKQRSREAAVHAGHFFLRDQVLFIAIFSSAICLFLLIGTHIGRSSRILQDLPSIFSSLSDNQMVMMMGWAMTDQEKLNAQREALRLVI